MRHIAIAASLALVAACSSPEESADTPAPDAAEAPADIADPAPAAAASDNTLTLEGLGDLRVGDAVPEGSSFAERGAQIPGSACHTVSSPDYPGVYAITVDGEVRRITVSGDSDVALTEGIGAGASEEDVREAFPGFREEPHKYVEAPAKYLTQPGDDPRLRFEIDGDGTVSLIHVGLMPELGYVEGCA